MADRIPLYPSLDFTENGTHGVGGTPHTVRGGSNVDENSGMAFDIIAVPNVGRMGPRVKEFPSPVAGTQFDGDASVVNPMDTD